MYIIIEVKITHITLYNIPHIELEVNRIYHIQLYFVLLHNKKRNIIINFVHILIEFYVNFQTKNEYNEYNTIKVLFIVLMTINGCTKILF